MQHPSSCPGDPAAVAEEYVMGSLPQDQVIAFEDHYVGCDACATVLEDTIEYVTAIRAAAATLHRTPADRSVNGGDGSSD
jgi:hypothetical protein